jgi:hypothetical protein
VHSLELDWNLFNGDESLFREYFITDYVPQPPDEEGGNEMQKYRVIWPNGVARRSGPATLFSNQGVYQSLMDVDVIQDDIPDANDPSNPNKIWVKFADGLYGAREYPTSAGTPASRMVEVVLPDPDPEPTLVHTIGVYLDGKISVDNGEPF